MTNPAGYRRPVFPLCGIALLLLCAACTGTPEALPLPATTTRLPTATTVEIPLPSPTYTYTPATPAESTDRCAGSALPPACSLRATPDAASPCLGINADTASRLTVNASLPLPAVRALAFSPDGARLAAVTGDADGNHAGATVLCSPAAAIDAEYPQPLATVWDAAYSPDGRFLAYSFACSHHACTLIRDRLSGKIIQTLTSGNAIYALDFSPDGSMLAMVGAPEEITWLYSTKDWSAVGELNPHEHIGYDVAFFPAGDRLAVAGIHGEIHFWNTRTQLMLGLLYQTEPVYRISISPDGKELASVYCASANPLTCEKGHVIIWDTAHGARIAQMGSRTQAAAFSPDGSILAVGSGPGDAHLRLYGTAAWKMLSDHEQEVDQLAFSPDGRFLATADGGGVKIWSAP